MSCIWRRWASARPSRSRSASKGIGVLFGLGKLVLTMYASQVLFVVVVLGTVITDRPHPAPAFYRRCASPSSSRSPRRRAKPPCRWRSKTWRSSACPKHIVGVRHPDRLQLQPGRHHPVPCRWPRCSWRRPPAFTSRFGQQLIMMLTLMLTSKGVAGVPRAALVILAGTLATSVCRGRRRGAAGHRCVMDMARTSVNVLGNCLASAVVARWEGDQAVRRAGGSQKPPRSRLPAAHTSFAVYLRVNAGILSPPKIPSTRSLWGPALPAAGPPRS